MVERVLVCLAIDDFFSIKSTSGIKRVAHLLNVCGYILAITNLTKKIEKKLGWGKLFSAVWAEGCALVDWCAAVGAEP